MTDGGGYRVLYMEDDAGLARLAQRRLQRAGLEVDVAPDGDSGLQMLEERLYDVIAVDQVMPGRSGLDVIRLLAERGPLPPMIMVTGTGSEQIAVEALKLGVGDYVVKDVNGGYLELLPTVVQQVLQRSHLAEEKEAAQRALRESEELLRQIVHGSAVATFVLDAGHIVTHWNRACEALTGIPAAHMVGTRQHWSAFYSCERPLLADYVVDGRDVDGSQGDLWQGVCPSPVVSCGHEFEGFFPRLGDGGRWLYVTVAPLRDGAGRTVGAIETMQDVTDRKHHAEELERANAELREALAKVRTLSGLLPICASCKRIRDDAGYWVQVESYLMEHSEAEFTHGICPECARKLYGEYLDDEDEDPVASAEG